MAKLESSFKNMVLSLTLVTLFAAAALGGMYMLTKEPIEQAKQQKQTAAIAKVLPPYQTLSEPVTTEQMVIYTAFDAQGEKVGAAVQTEENGFGGKFKIMVGFDAQGRIYGYEVLEQQETPGLGTHMVEWFKTDKNDQSIIGKQPAQANLTVKKDGGEVDAITAATISSRAFLLAVGKAYAAFEQNTQASPTDAASGATALCADSANVTADIAAEVAEVVTDTINSKVE